MWRGGGRRVGRCRRRPVLESGAQGVRRDEGRNRDARAREAVVRVRRTEAEALGLAVVAGIRQVARSGSASSAACRGALHACTDATDGPGSGTLARAESHRTDDFAEFKGRVGLEHSAVEDSAHLDAHCCRVAHGLNDIRDCGPHALKHSAVRRRGTDALWLRRH